MRWVLLISLVFVHVAHAVPETPLAQQAINSPNTIAAQSSMKASGTGPAGIAIRTDNPSTTPVRSSSSGRQRVGAALFSNTDNDGEDDSSGQGEDAIDVGGGKAMGKDGTSAVFTEFDPSDPCTQLSFQPNYNTARECLNSFPFDVEVFRHTMDVIKRTLQLNVYLDLARFPPDPITPPYDLRKAVEAIAARENWSTEREWQEALMDAFIPMNDGHSQFIPYCFTRIVFRQPFIPIARMDGNGVTRFYIGAVSVHAETKDEAYLGREITAIDDVPAKTYFESYAETIGIFKNAASRFSELFAKREWSHDDMQWVMRLGYFSSRNRLPKTKSMKWTLTPTAATNQKKEEVIRDWIVVLPDEPFSNSVDFQIKFCYVKEEEMAVKDKAKQRFMDPIYQAMRRLFLATPAAIESDFFQAYRIDVFKSTALSPAKKPETKAKFAWNGKITLPTASEMNIYAAELNEDVAVLALPTFNVQGEEQKMVWRSDMLNMLAMINQSKAKKLIIDLSGNGGGNLCLVSELLSVLAPSKEKAFPHLDKQFVKDQRESKLSLLLAKLSVTQKMTNGTFHPSTKKNAATKKPFDNLDWTNPVRQHPALVQTYGKANNAEPKDLMDKVAYATDPSKNTGSFSYYSQLFTDRCSKAEDNPLQFLRETDNLWRFAPNDLALLSSGDCGSACGIFYHYLRENHNINAYVLGYRKDEVRRFSAFEGGQAYSLDDLYKVMHDLELPASDVVPAKIKIQAYVSFPLREAYSNQVPSKPLEYMDVHPNQQVDVDDELWFRPDLVWLRVAQRQGWLVGH